MSQDSFATNQTDNKQNFRDSSYKFTDPIRVYKATDPHYWEIDNLPINQLQENILWLKDQIAGATSVSGFDRKLFNELRPFSEGTSRTVKVLPGKFTGRVNDAYQKGITSISVDQTRDIETNVSKRVSFTLSDPVMRTLIGLDLSSSLGNNGLYDHILHYNAHEFDGSILDYFEGTVASIADHETKGTFFDIPHAKRALWRAFNTSKNHGINSSSGAQINTEYVRKWGGTARTAVVNVPDSLSIDIEEFSDADYSINNTTFVANTRIDLVFVFTHPVDASSTALPLNIGGSPKTITSPTLGIVKGAGLISMKRPKGATSLFRDDMDILTTPTLLDDSDWVTKANDATNYYESSSTGDDTLVNIASHLADQSQTVEGFKDLNVFGNFPSPDDLLNFAPLLMEELESNSFYLLGQSVLPLCYVIVRKGQTNITDSDIIDIRPFLRTAELTYNERSGLAASIPPLGFSNPVVGRRQLDQSTRKLKSFLEQKIDAASVEKPRAVAGGIIFGGKWYGPEGAIATLTESGETSVDISALDSSELDLWFVENTELPSTFGGLRNLPDWDLALWTGGVSNPGNSRNDRINVSRQFAGDNIGNKNLFISEDSTISSDIKTAFPPVVNTQSDVVRTGLVRYYAKKKIFIDRTSVPWMGTYDVDARFLNCIPITCQDLESFASQTSVAWKQSAGIHIEKYPDHFNIIVTWTAVDPGISQTSSDIINRQFGDHPKESRNDSSFSGFMVTHDLLDFIQNNTVFSDDSVEQSADTPPVMCTYPTVSFTVTGYPLDFKVRTNLDTDGPTIVFQS